MEKILIETGVKDRIEGMNLKYTKVNNANKKELYVHDGDCYVDFSSWLKRKKPFKHTI